jgi:tetratricopeptide (TPR) repeat protein
MNLEPESPDCLEAKAHFAQAYSFYEKTEEFEQALLECDTAIEIDPSLTAAHNLRGIVLEKLGRNAEAREAYKQALELDPDFCEAEDNLAALEDKLALLPRWLRSGIVGRIFLFLAVTYSLELYLFSGSHFFIWLDVLLSVVLFTLYTPGIIVQLFLGSTGLESDFNWTIRSISSLTFGYIGYAITLKRKKYCGLLQSYFCLCICYFSVLGVFCY